MYFFVDSHWLLCWGKIWKLFGFPRVIGHVTTNQLLTTVRCLLQFSSGGRPFVAIFSVEFTRLSFSSVDTYAALSCVRDLFKCITIVCLLDKYYRLDVSFNSFVSRNDAVFFYVFCSFNRVENDRRRVSNMELYSKRKSRGYCFCDNTLSGFTQHNIGYPFYLVWRPANLGECLY